MADPIKGEDVLIQFEKGGDYFNYACAKEVTVNFEMETKSVKTVGSGTWDKKRGQKKRYTVDLSGVVKFDDGTVPHAFDIYDYFDQMVPMNYRIYFTETETTLVKIIQGTILPTNLNLGGGSEGHADGSATFEGDGAPTVSDSLSVCNATLGTFTANSSEDSPGVVALNFTDGVSNTVRVEFSIDGGGRDVFFPAATETPFLHNITGVAPGLHSIEFFPVCENGLDGTSQTKSVTVF